MPSPQGQGSPLTDHQIQEITSLLKNTDMSMREIAGTLECTRIAVSDINRRHNIRTGQNQGKGKVTREAV